MAAAERHGFMVQEVLEKKKVIFLDVDGVLAYENYHNKGTSSIDTRKVVLLKEICDRTGAAVVISSSWRGSRTIIPSVYWTLISILEKNGIKVLGNTPFVSQKGADEICRAGSRVFEIMKWLEKNKTDNFVILDDADWGLEEAGFAACWVQPVWFGDGGLKREHVEKAVEILGELDSCTAVAG